MKLTILSVAQWKIIRFVAIRYDNSLDSLRSDMIRLRFTANTYCRGYDSLRSVMINVSILAIRYDQVTIHFDDILS